MRSTMLLVTLTAVGTVLSSGVVSSDAGLAHQHGAAVARRAHVHIHSQGRSKLAKRAASTTKKRNCKAKQAVVAAGDNADSGSGGSGGENKTSNSSKGSGDDGGDDGGDSGSSSSGGGGGSSSTGASGKVTTFQFSECGDNGATADVRADSGPNGSNRWITCGIKKGASTGWNPPPIKLKDMIYTSLSEALKSSNSPFKACSKYVDQFEAAAKKYNLPSIMIASFAMQESSCNPNVDGQGGEVGMFQLSKDKCGSMSREACKVVSTNLGIGAAFMADQLKRANGNVFLMLGRYNGWDEGLTYARATRAANSKCCHCQNNLDYIHQVVNGYWQNSNKRLGTFFNLDVCDNKRRRRYEALPLDNPLSKREALPEGVWRF